MRTRWVGNQSLEAFEPLGLLCAVRWVIGDWVLLRPQKRLHRSRFSKQQLLHGEQETARLDRTKSGGIMRTWERRRESLYTCPPRIRWTLKTYRFVANPSQMTLGRLIWDLRSCCIVFVLGHIHMKLLDPYNFWIRNPCIFFSNVSAFSSSCRKWKCINWHNLEWDLCAMLLFCHFSLCAT